MAKKKLNVLHLASFSGNIGDNANHIGTRSQFAKNLDFELFFTELEIREFYWRQRLFDEEFVRAEDLEMNIRMKKMGKKILVLPHLKIKK